MYVINLIGFRASFLRAKIYLICAPVAKSNMLLFVDQMGFQLAQDILWNKNNSIF